MQMDAYKTIDTIVHLQKRFPSLILCGSVSLILLDILPNRSVGDIDFATTDVNVIGKLNLRQDSYDDEETNGGYTSFSGYYRANKINVLFFTLDTEIKTETITTPTDTIRSQLVSDILYWKEKYNRTKDLSDLDSISLNMLEKAVFDK